MALTIPEALEAAADFRRIAGELERCAQEIPYAAEEKIHGGAVMVRAGAQIAALQGALEKLSANVAD